LHQPRWLMAGGRRPAGSAFRAVASTTRTLVRGRLGPRRRPARWTFRCLASTTFADGPAARRPRDVPARRSRP
jgi:hypothetical protein